MRFYSVKQSLTPTTYFFFSAKKTRAFFKDLVSKGNRSSYVQVTLYHCEKPICMRCTVTRLARESVGLCPLSSFVREGIRVITQ